MAALSHTIMTFITAFLLCVVIGGPVIRMLRNLKAKQAISEDAPERHQAKQGTPTMGGVMILCALAVASLAFGGLRLLPPVVITLAFGAIGFLDDFLIARRGKNLGLKARQKLALQFLLAIGAVAWIAGSPQNHYVELIWNPLSADGSLNLDFGFWYYPFAVLIIVGMSNAVNLADGLDGLSAGTMVASMVPVAFTALVLNLPAGVFCSAVAGACLGFLWFNSHPAKVFMGDTGSLALGAALAVAGIMSKLEIFLLFFGFIFIIEALSVTLQVIYFKSTNGKRIFRMSPLHHHFELSGWAETRVVTRFWLIQTIFSAVGMWILFTFYQTTH